MLIFADKPYCFSRVNDLTLLGVGKRLQFVIHMWLFYMYVMPILVQRAWMLACPLLFYMSVMPIFV